MHLPNPALALFSTSEHFYSVDPNYEALRKQLPPFEKAALRLARQQFVEGGLANTSSGHTTKVRRQNLNVE